MKLKHLGKVNEEKHQSIGHGPKSMPKNPNVKKDNSFNLYENLDSEINFKNAADLNRLKQILMSHSAIVFTSNIIKIALNYKEDRIAAVILANYYIIIDESTLNFAVMQSCFGFIQNMFLFNKRDYHVMTNGSIDDQGSSNQYEKGYMEDARIKQFAIDDLIVKICLYFEKKECERLLFNVVGWNYEPRGNILKILCERGFEKIATIYMSNYPMLSDEEFFFECIAEEREIFLKCALTDQFFDLDYMHNQRAIRQIIDRMFTGNNIIFSLNLLLYANFRKWPNELLNDFTKAAALLISQDLDRNLLLISHNPIMALGLFIQFLNRLKSEFNEFDMECVKLAGKFEKLGRLIIDKMQFNNVEETFMEKDFLDRTVLNIITENVIMPFIVINKLHFLINKIWDGKDADLIDGKTEHFSRTKYLINHEIKRLRGVNVTIKDIIGENFTPNINEFNFNYQFKFRTRSVLMIFWTDFLCAFFIVCMFQYINYSYLNLFTVRRYQDASTYDDKIAIIAKNIETYKHFNFVGTILSISYFINFFCRVIYNSKNKKKINFDLWLYFDIVAGVINILAFNIVGGTSPESILNVQTKRSFDYYMILVLIISWLRFFSYFLVISHISKITLTLFMMLRETVYFMMILGSYMALMTTVFATLFRDCQTDDAISSYHSFWMTLRSLIDYFLANYYVKDLGSYSTSHSVLLITHVTISNIFLLNFLVAILQTVYEAMIRNGDFYSTQYQYIFITKYLKAMEEDNGYDKLIVFPPPLNFLLVPLLLVFPSRRAVKKIAQLTAKIFYWFINIFFISLFFLYMIAHDPLIIFKIYLQIFTKIDGLFKKINYLIAWTLFGFAYLLYVNFYDTCMLVNILCQEDRVTIDQGEEERHKKESLEFQITRNIIRAIKILKEIGDRSFVVFCKRQNVQRMQTQKMSLKDKIKHQQNEMRNEDIYIVRKELIIAVYEEISTQNRYIKNHRKQTLLESSDNSHPRASTHFTNASNATSQDMNITHHSNNNKSPIVAQSNHPQTFTAAAGGTGLLDEKRFKNQEPTISSELREIISRLLLSRNRDSIGELFEYMMKEKEKSKFATYVYMTEEEATIVDKFLSKFSIMQQHQETMTIDLDLVVKGFPKVVTKNNISKIKLLNFQRMHRTLIGFYNVDHDENYAFNDKSQARGGRGTDGQNNVQSALSHGFLNKKSIFEGRMIRRLDLMRDQVVDNSANIDKILEVSKKVFDSLIFKNHLGSIIMNMKRNSSMPPQQQQLSIPNQMSQMLFLKSNSNVGKLQKQVTISEHQDHPSALKKQVTLPALKGSLKVGLLNNSLRESQNNIIIIDNENQRVQQIMAGIQQKHQVNIQQKIIQNVVPLQDQYMPPQLEEEKMLSAGTGEPDLSAIADIDAVLDLDFELKKIQQKIDELRSKRNLLDKPKKRTSGSDQGTYTIFTPPPSSLQPQIVRELVDEENSESSANSKSQNPGQSQPSAPFALPIPRKSFLLHANTKIIEKNSTSSQQLDIPASPILQNYHTSIFSHGEGKQSNRHVEIDASGEMNVTAEQVLQQLRMKRNKNSNGEGVSNYSGNDIQEFSASDFSSYYTQIAVNKRVSNPTIAGSPSYTMAPGGKGSGRTKTAQDNRRPSQNQGQVANAKVSIAPSSSPKNSKPRQIVDSFKSDSESEIQNNLNASYKQAEP